MRTIAAIATPLLNCAIHIIRVSGPNCFEYVSKICKKKIESKPYSIQRNYIIDNDKIIDDVLLNVFVKPKSYTGEDTIEINCHGGVIVAKKILSLLLINGCDLANNGEFSQQAYINKKIDYSQAEAINNLINATNEVAISYAIDCLVNNGYKKLELIRNKLFDITGSIDVNIDYPEYDDVPQYNHEQIFKMVNDIKNDLLNIIKESEFIIPVFNGFNVVIIGEPNVGKSSLLNLLYKEERAIVSTTKGTTRDIIEAKVNIDGVTINLIDTAGIHETDDEIEKIGISKTFDAIEKADIVIWLIDNISNNNLENVNLANKNVIKVYNKKDINNYPKDVIKISVKEGDISELIERFKVEIEKISNFKSSNIILQSDRQIIAMKKIINILDNCLYELENKSPLDLLQSDFEKCIILFNNILGINFEYDKLDELFSKFCLGK